MVDRRIASLDDQFIHGDRDRLPKIQPQRQRRCRRIRAVFASIRVKTAVIRRITSQDGSYLAELLLRQGRQVPGMSRRASIFSFGLADDHRRFVSALEISNPMAAPKFLFVLTRMIHARTVLHDSVSRIRRSPAQASITRTQIVDYLIAFMLMVASGRYRIYLHGADKMMLVLSLRVIDDGSTDRVAKVAAKVGVGVLGEQPGTNMEMKSASFSGLRDVKINQPGPAMARLGASYSERAFIFGSVASRSELPGSSNIEVMLTHIMALCALPQRACRRVALSSDPGQQIVNEGLTDCR